MNVKAQRNTMTPEQLAAYKAWEHESEVYLTGKGLPLQPLLDAQNRCRELGVPGFPKK